MEPVHQLAVAFGAAVLAGIAARRLGLPVVPAYVLAGLALGPAGAGLVAQPSLLEPLALLGLVLLLFFMGLDASAAGLAAAPLRTAKDGALDFALNFTPGLVLGLAFGWDPLLAALLGLASYATSSGVAVKGIIELRRSANADTGVVLNLMVVEDVATAVVLAGVASLAFSGSTHLGAMAAAAGKALLLCGAFLLLLRPLAQRLGRRALPLRPARSPELAILGALAAVLAAAALAERAGVSAALGAFLLGLTLADSPFGPRLRERVVPLRDASVALFFLAFGTRVEFARVHEALPLLLLLVPVTLATKFATGLLVAARRGQTRKARLNVATTLLPRGEFSIVVADVAAAAGLGTRLSAVAGVYVVVTAVFGSLLMAATGRLARATEQRARFHPSLGARLRAASRRPARRGAAFTTFLVPGLRGGTGRGPG